MPNMDPGLFDKLWTVLAMICGALIPVAFKTGLTPRQIVINTLVGVAGAAFVSPAVVEWLELRSPQMEAAIAFAVGLVAWQACEWLVRNGHSLLDRFSKNLPGGGA